jgi:hypothetical protein
MSWLPAMMWMRMLDDDELEEQSSTGCNAGYTPLVDEIRTPVTDGTPTNNNNSNNAEDAPTVAPRAWHHTAMSAATFTLSALLAYVATEAICKRIRGRN